MRKRDRFDEGDDADERFFEPDYWRDVLGGGATADHLVQMPAIRRAIAAGDADAVRKAFESVKKRSRARSELAALNAALESPRAFATEAFAAPSLWRVNGVGTGLYGRAGYDSIDKTYVKTRFITVLWVPLLPLDSWLVADARRGWYFLAQVPLSKALRSVQLACVGLALLLVLVAMKLALHFANHADLHLVNGLDVPVTVMLGTERVEVPAGDRVEVEVEKGPVSLICTDAVGSVIEEVDETLTSSHEAAIYNVLGAAPLYVRLVPYSVGAAAERKAEEIARTDWHAGTSWVALDRLDFAFRNPPAGIDMPRGKDLVTRVEVGVLHGGWREALAVAEETVSAAAAAQLAARVACVSTDVDGAAKDALASVLALDERDAARVVFDAYFRDHPGSHPALERVRKLLDAPPSAMGVDDDEVPSFTREELDALLADIRGKFARIAFVPGLSIEDDPDARSRLGGRPWLPQGEAWPQCGACDAHMPLFVQLDLDTLPEDAPSLGGKGLLQVFFCTDLECDDEDSWAPFKGLGKLVRVVDDSGPGAVATADRSPEGWPSRPIATWARFDDLPSWDELAELHEYDGDAVATAYTDTETDEWLYPVYGEKLGGWANWIQGVEYASCRKCGRAMDVLFQIESDAAFPFNWGDAGAAHVQGCAEHPEVVTLTWACF